MKRHPLYLACMLLMAAGLFTACEENGNTDDPENAPTNYWAKSYAYHLQLKGKVKTVITDTFTTQTFDEKGNLLTDRYDHENGYSLETYIYNAGGKLVERRLVEQSQSNTWGDTVKIHYGNHGKYVPISGYHIDRNGLYYNVDRLEGSENDVRYVASGDSILMISSYTYTYQGVPETESDTIGLGYDGGKYPVRLNSGFMWGRYTYADDGRFLTAEWGHGQGEYTSGSKNTYSSQVPYQTVIMEEYFNGGIKTSETTFTYNEHHDPTGSISGTYESKYENYVYDAQGNWTERMSSYKNGPTWSTPVKQTRQITYWD